ncbi:acyl-homoserine-lactone synthase [Neorhizobium sp. T7_12]|uniref:acyl-homoserine-lactone synthase n=1 Tax=Neorhizobium sp. T7_12 TaxID=2093832 RepID=UPI000CF986E4|nr:acyl-homoserine-lactone synthase [Neorhizobium sp. T7_12]
MKIIALQTSNHHVERTLLEKMFALRARVFQGRLNWDVSVVAGEERDEFDELDPYYLLAVGARDDVLGTARLLPAIGPTMLERKFPVLLPQGKLVPHSRMVESSRFCVDTFSPGRSKGLLHDATLSLFAAIIEWSIKHGYDEIVTATDLRFERLLRHAGWPMKRLGEPQLIGNVDSIGGILKADSQSLALIRPATYELIESTDPLAASDVSMKSIDGTAWPVARQ